MGVDCCASHSSLLLLHLLIRSFVAAPVCICVCTGCRDPRDAARRCSRCFPFSSSPLSAAFFVFLSPLLSTRASASSTSTPLSSSVFATTTTIVFSPVFFCACSLLFSRRFNVSFATFSRFFFFTGFVCASYFIMFLFCRFRCACVLALCCLPVSSTHLFFFLVFSRWWDGRLNWVFFLWFASSLT